MGSRTSARCAKLQLNTAFPEGRVYNTNACAACFARVCTAARRDQTFLVHVRDKIIPLKREDIAFCYTCNEKVTAYTFAGASYPLDKTLEALQAVLPEADFFRANRQFIVARRAVKEIAVWFGSRLALHLTVGTPERIVISKARVPEFKAWLTSVQPAE